jgi:hypothetical protein
MKKNSFSHALCTGVFSSLLVLSLILFAACGGDDDDDTPSGPTVEVPKTGDMPAIPEGTSAVGNATEAQTLIAAVESAYLNCYNAVEDLIDSKTSEDKDSTTRTWNFSDLKTTDGKIQVTSKGESKMTGAWVKVGDTYEYSYNFDTIAKYIVDITSDTVTVKLGSTFAEKQNMSQKGTVKAVVVDDEGDTRTEGDLNLSNETAYSFGLTAAANGKGGKIILSASRKQSFNGTYNKDTEFPDPTISGSLKVYGANDAEVYSQTIDTEARLNDALALIGYSHK